MPCKHWWSLARTPGNFRIRVKGSRTWMSKTCRKCENTRERLRLRANPEARERKNARKRERARELYQSQSVQAMRQAFLVHGLGSKSAIRSQQETGGNQ